MGGNATWDAEIEEFLVDTYDDGEVASAWAMAFEDSIAVPFEATLLGIPVTVTEFRVHGDSTLQCHIRGEKRERWVGIEDLDDESLPEEMMHVLDLYRYWGGA